MITRRWGEEVPRSKLRVENRKQYITYYHSDGATSGFAISFAMPGHHSSCQAAAVMPRSFPGGAANIVIMISSSWVYAGSA